MPVNTFIDFKTAYIDALSRAEDSIIEVSDSFSLLEELPPINHGYKLTISSINGSFAIGTKEGAPIGFTHFSVKRGKLILENITLSADLSDPELLGHGGIEVGNHGNLYLNKAAIENCLNTMAGAVWVQRNGTFTLSDSSIRNCHGNLAGAVWVDEGGYFLMEYASTIEDTHILNGPSGSQIVISGTFIMTNGLITFTAQPIWNGISVQEEGIFQMEDGTISNCLTAVTIASGSYTIIKGGFIENNDTGIITSLGGIRKTLEFHGGEIHSNRIGIGINEGCYMTMTGGKIYNHQGMDGVGILSIYGSKGSFIMSGGEIFQNIQGICWQQNQVGCLIEGDAKIYENGYGILMDHATVTMRGGEIYGNTMPAHQYAYGGIGVFCGYFGNFNFYGGEIYNNEHFGILAQYWATIKMENASIYNNGIDGVHLDYSDFQMSDGQIYENGQCGISLDKALVDEPRGSKFTMIGGHIRNNGEDGIRLMGISRCELTGGEIFNNSQAGIKCLHQTETIIWDGKIYRNYIGMELTGNTTGNTAVLTQLTGGNIFENTVGIKIDFNGKLTMEGGEVYNNHGILDSMPNEEGGIGILINQGSVLMNDGCIYGHHGFPAVPSIMAYGQQLGAAVCLLGSGTFQMLSGKIIDNQAPSGAAIFTPNYNYLRISKDAYFDCNKSDEYPYHYNGGIHSVDSKIFFSHTSVGCHILNNYDVNFNAGEVIATKYTDFFPDINFAQLIFRQLDRKWEAYIAPCEFAPITVLNANDLHIHSIRGIQFLFNLEQINLNDNHVLDLSPLGHFNEIKFEAYRQWRKLPPIYVSRSQELAIYGPFIEIIEPGTEELDDEEEYANFEGLETWQPEWEIKKLVKNTDIFKCHGKYFPKLKNKELLWIEPGNNAVKWQSENFDGTVFQRSIPIPINLLFPNPGVAAKIANLLHKNIEDTIHIMELHRITLLDLSHIPLAHRQTSEISDLEGLQFFFNLSTLILKDNGDPGITELEAFLFFLTSDYLEISNFTNLKIIT